MCHQRNPRQSMLLADKPRSQFHLLARILDPAKRFASLRHFSHRGIRIGLTVAMEIQAPHMEPAAHKSSRQDRPSKRCAIDSAEENVAPCTYSTAPRTGVPTGGGKCRRNSDSPAWQLGMRKCRSRASSSESQTLGLASIGQLHRRYTVPDMLRPPPHYHRCCFGPGRSVTPRRSRSSRSGSRGG